MPGYITLCPQEKGTLKYSNQLCILTLSTKGDIDMIQDMHVLELKAINRPIPSPPASETLCEWCYGSAGSSHNDKVKSTHLLKTGVMTAS